MNTADVSTKNIKTLFYQDPPKIFSEMSSCKKTSSFHHSSAHIQYNSNFQVDPLPTALSIKFPIQVNFKSFDSTVKMFRMQVLD